MTLHEELLATAALGEEIKAMTRQAVRAAATAYCGSQHQEEIARLAEVSGADRADIAEAWRSMARLMLRQAEQLAEFYAREMGPLKPFLPPPPDDPRGFLERLTGVKPPRLLREFPEPWRGDRRGRR